MTPVRKSMATLWPSIRISFVLTLITTSLILIADLLGVIPNQTEYELKSRKQLSESLAVLFSTLASESDIKKTRTVLSKIVIRNDELLSAGFRMLSGNLLFEVGPHVDNWKAYENNKSTPTHVLVPIFRKRKQLGFIELRFTELSSSLSSDIFDNATYKLILFIVILGFFSFLFFILRTLRQIDPSSVIPDRVNAAFDTLSEGLVILDKKEQIVLANIAFCETVKRKPSELLGFKLSELNWKEASGDAGDILYPWLISMSTGESIVGETLVLTINPDNKRSLTVNCAPINDNQRNRQGVLLTFDDVTKLEIQKQQLQHTVSDLEYSQKEIQRQNKELHFLATRDPLTGCLNRRSFNEKFNKSFLHAQTQQEQLCCIMVDLDHFKKVNDNYGHAVGDEVIKLLADILISSTRDIDIVGRYGGEEFCIVLPGLDIDDAIVVAERIRLRIKDESTSTFSSGPRVTTSLGVSSIFDNAKAPSELINQADQALYFAKESGRNRVERWSAYTELQSVSQENVIQEQSIIQNEVVVGTEDIHSARIPFSDHTKNTEEIIRLQTQIKQLESLALGTTKQLQQEQNYDNLTGLPNQTLFYDRVNQAVKRCERDGRLTTLLIVDIDLFITQVSAGFNSDIANQMFIVLSKRLSNIFRTSDSITQTINKDDLSIFRFNRDQFGVLLSDFDNRMVVPWMVKRIFVAMGEPILSEEKAVNVSCKIGISIFPEDATSSQDLVNHANTANTYAKKDINLNSYQFFDSEMQKASIKRLVLEAEIRQAIDNDEWLLYYQPKMDISTNTIKSVEALIRWNHPQKGLVGPFEFIELAEERGLIIEIGEWVLREACKQAKIWADNGFDIKVAINLSPVQLSQKNCSNLIIDIITETQVQPRNLELEVTETSLMNNLEMAVNTLNRLNCRGVSISIDDFGTGYSSLVYLKQLPIDTLKIDRIFIKDIMNDDNDKNIVTSVIAMAHALNLKVIAEGVETQEQYDLLKDMKCDSIQGYILSKPVDADSATKLFDQRFKFNSQHISHDH